MDHIEYLESIKACSDAIKWCEQYPDAQTCWDKCTHPDWMLWILGRISSRKTLISITVYTIRPIVEKHTTNKHVTACLNACDAWVEGGINDDELLMYARATYAAAYAATTYDAIYAAHAAYAAYAAAHDAAHAAHAAAHAAYAANAAAHAAARTVSITVTFTAYSDNAATEMCARIREKCPKINLNKQNENKGE